jgi:D-alanyl-D-alanine carboxypeptidase
LVLFVAGCGQARFSAPPEPAFTHGLPAQTSIPSATQPEPASDAPVEPSRVVPDHLEPAPSLPTAAPSGEGDEAQAETAAPESGGIAVEAMVIVDDAGIAVPNRTGWGAFDAALSSRLVPADVSASVAVMVDGQLVHQAAYGERVPRSGEPADVSDRYRIASISKTITAIVVMQMVERGELPFDEPVGQILLDYLGVTPSDPDAAGLTVHQLLTHTSGFGKHQPTFFANGAVSYSDAARTGMSGSVSPGAAYSYSNMNFAVLSVLIEAVTGQAYERVVTEQLLTPLGITGMRMTATHELGPDEASHFPTPGRQYMEPLGGAGAWNATPSEIVAIYNSIDPHTPGWKALAPDTLAMMRSGVPTGSASSYGLGIINYPGDAWGHTGTIEHAHSMVLVQPDGVTWAVTVAGETPSNTPSLRNIVRTALAAGFPD